MNTSSFLRPKPEIRLDYSSDSQRHKQNAFYVPSASRSKHAKHSATTRGYTSDSGHAAPATSAPASSRAYEPSRQRTDPGTSYAYTTQASSSSKHPYPTDTYTAPRPQQPPGASTATPSYDSRAYAQRAPDRTTTATPSHHSRPHETSKPSRHRAHDHAIPPAAPPTPQPYAVPATAESHRSGHRSRRHAEDSQRATERAQAEANARAQAEAAARAQEAAARARAEAERARLAAEEAERAKEKAAAKARRRELRAQQEAEAKRQLEMQAEVEKRRRKEEKRAERRRAELEAERQRAEQERLRLQPSTSREAAQHPRVVSAKESRTARVKDSDESDNSARRYAPSVKSRHQRYASAPAAATLAPATAGSSPGQPIQQIQVPAVSSSQTSYPRQPAGYPDNAPASSRETLRQYPTAAPPSRPKHTKGASWSHNASAPYPPGYAVSGSDSEAAVRKPQRLKKPYRPSRAPADTPAAAAPAAPAPVAPTMSRSSSKGKTLGDMANWLFNRSDSKQDKKAANGGTSAPAADVQQQQQQQQQPPGVATVPLPARSAPSPVVSIKAGQGPSDGNFVRQRTNSSSGQPNPVDPRSVQAQTNQIPSHIEVLMQAHAASQPSMDTRQGYLSPAHQAVQSMAPSPPVLQPPKPSHTASQPLVYQSQSYVTSASHIATVAPSITVPSPSPGVPQAPTSAPPHPTAAYNTYSHAAPYGQQTSATAVSRSGHAGREVPERNQTTPAPTSRYKSSPPRENFQQSSSYAIPDSTGRYPNAPDGPQAPSYNRQVDSKATVTSPPPANEDSPGRSSHRQHTRRPSTASLRPQTRDEQRLAATAQQTGYTYAIDPRATRTAKTSSPGQNPSNVPPNSTPPKNTSQPIPSPHTLPQASSASYAYDPSRSQAPISQPSTYPDTIVYPASASRVDAAHAQPTVAPNSSYNSSSRTASGNPSRYQSSSNPQPQTQPQPHAYPVATHISARSASNDTGSTTLVGHTPPQFMSAIASEARATELPSSSPGSRHPVAVPAVAPSASSGRHHSSRHHSNSPPQTTPPTVQPPIPSTKTSSQGNYPSNIAVPQPARSFTTPEPRRINTPAPIRIPARDFSSPGISDDLNTPSSLEHTPKELYANTLHPVTTTQSLPEGKKKASFFGGFFRPRTGTKPGPNEHILQPKTPEPRTTRQQPQSAKPSSSSAAKAPLPFPTDDARKASRRERAPSPDATPPATYANPPAYDTLAKKDGRQYRLFDKRLRTVSGLSAEAVDGTNAGASTVRASPASSLRSSTPRLSPPFRDPVQATYDWRDRAEADEYGRSSMRRRRPGVTFDGYDELPQAESHDMPYVRRMAARRQPIPQQLIEQT